MTPKTTSEALERKTFEDAWMNGVIERPEHQRKGYTAEDVERAEKDAAWEAWQVRASLHPPGEQPATAGGERPVWQLGLTAEQIARVEELHAKLQASPMDGESFLTVRADNAKPADFQCDGPGHSPAYLAEQDSAKPAGEPFKDEPLWSVINELRAEAAEALAHDPAVGIRADRELADKLTDWAARLETTPSAFYEDVYAQCCEAIKPLVDAGKLPGSVVESLQTLVAALADSAKPAGEPTQGEFVIRVEKLLWEHLHYDVNNCTADALDAFCTALAPTSPALQESKAVTITDEQITAACDQIFLSAYPETRDYDIAIARAVLALAGGKRGGE